MISAWTSTTTLRLPSILGLLKNPESLVSRFKEVGNKYRAAEQADLDSDGGTDVLIPHRGNADRLDFGIGQEGMIVGVALVRRDAESVPHLVQPRLRASADRRDFDLWDTREDFTMLFAKPPQSNDSDLDLSHAEDDGRKGATQASAR